MEKNEQSTEQFVVRVCTGVGPDGKPRFRCRVVTSVREGQRVTKKSQIEQPATKEGGRLH